MPTNDAQLLVLSALAEGPLHGYAINAAIERLSGTRLGPGSLYGALARLESKGLVEGVEGTAGRERQRPVRLTDAGRALLEETAQTMARVSDRVFEVFESAVPDRTGYLDRLAATEEARSYKSVMLKALAPRPGQTVLDLGCGPGTDLEALAGAVGGEGRVIGVDMDPDMAARARERTADVPAVQVRQTDITALPLPDADADLARTDRVLQHVADPAAALAEARRVLRPGGRLVMGEPDWDSLAVDHPDLESARGYARHITDRVVRRGAIGRQLPRLAEEAGFEVPAVVPVTSVFRDVGAADRVLGLERNTRRAVEAGYLTERAAGDFLAHLAERPFFAAVTLYVVVAEVPAAP
ncbi:methyltransferase domain-containing protein [Streptomyces sp. NPDC050560]|uniref:methyltransferase domain-containing protein n=1 Tax=Streptomyces sp. NPDC050560 TaxID=3365630 RepID=UPI003792ACC9